MMFLWLSQVGSEMYTQRGRYWLRKVKPRLRAPVPEIAWQVATRPYLMAMLSAPKSKFRAPVLNSARPSIGRYSWKIRQKTYFIGSLDDFLLNFLDNLEYVWFSVVVSVSSDTEIDLVGALVVIEGNGGSKDGVWGSHGHVGEEVIVDLGRGEVQAEFLKPFHRLMGITSIWLL